MKTLFTLLVILFAANLVKAQPVVTSDILLTIGDERLVSYAETAFDPGEAGTDQTWDFSNIQHSYDVTWFAVDPDNTGFIDLFPTADIAFMVPGDDTEDFYSDGWIFYNTGNGDEISLLGSVIYNFQGTNIDTNLFLFNDDPDLLFEFPMTYPDQFSDDVAGTAIVTFQNQQFEVERSGSTTTEVDGYGTLITPEGTFDNVIRVKRTETLTDLFMGIPTYHEIERYDWFSPDYDYLLYHTEEIVIKDATGNEQNRTTQTYYAEPNLISGIQTVKVEKFDVHPNPCQGVFHLPENLNQKGARIGIINMQAKMVYSGQLQSSVVDVSFLSRGMYVVVVTDKDGDVYRSQVVIN